MRSKISFQAFILLALLFSFVLPQMSILAVSDIKPLTTIITIPYVSQYATGATTKNQDCGPDSVLMVTQAYGKRPSNLSNKEFIADIRKKMGKPGKVFTSNEDRIKALAAYGLPSAAITTSNFVQAMKNAISQGKLIIARIDAATLGRVPLGKQNYTHAVVVTGFSDNGQTVYVNDPDNRFSNTATPGGGPNKAWPIAKFQKAVKAAKSPFGLVIGASISPLLAPVKHPRIVADVNGDGKADIVGFGDNDVYVSLSTGSGFSEPQAWISGAYTYDGGVWRVEKHVRTVADVNGDGKADIVGFGDNDVYVSLSTGSGFGAPQSWINTAFTYNNGGWRVEKHVRVMADVNSDGKADIVGFGDNDVYVSLSTGSGFGAPQSWINTAFTYNNGGWRVEKHVRVMADVNGDGKADIVGFGDNDVYVSLSTGSGFGAPQSWINTAFTYNNGDWRNEKHIRTLKDVNGDGKADIVGFGDNDVYISLSTSSAFSTPQSWINAYVYNIGGWR